MEEKGNNEEISPKVSNSYKDIIPQTSNIQNEQQLQWDGLDPNKSYDWKNAVLNINNNQSNIIQQNIPAKDCNR